MQFGLQPGDELKIETTICRTVRECRLPIVIKHVSEVAACCSDPMLTLQSYISMPIFIQNGSLFGTLCALVKVETMDISVLLAGLSRFSWTAPRGIFPARSPCLIELATAELWAQSLLRTGDNQP